MSIYTITKIDVDMYEPSSHTVKIRKTFEEAESLFNEFHNDFVENISIYEEDMEKWLSNNLHEEHRCKDYLYIHYVYCDGSETIISVSKHELGEEMV